MPILEGHKPLARQQCLQEGYAAGVFYAFPVTTTSRHQPKHESLPFIIFKELKQSITENSVHSSFIKGIIEAKRKWI